MKRAFQKPTKPMKRAFQKPQFYCTFRPKPACVQFGGDEWEHGNLGVSDECDSPAYDSKDSCDTECNTLYGNLRNIEEIAKRSFYDHTRELQIKALNFCGLRHYELNCLNYLLRRHGQKPILITNNDLRFAGNSLCNDNRSVSAKFFSLIKKEPKLIHRAFIIHDEYSPYLDYDFMMVIYADSALLVEFVSGTTSFELVPSLSFHVADKHHSITHQAILKNYQNLYVYYQKELAKRKNVQNKIWYMKTNDKIWYNEDEDKDFAPKRKFQTKEGEGEAMKEGQPA